MQTQATETENKTASHTPIRFRPVTFGSDLFGSLLSGLFGKPDKVSFDDAPVADTLPTVVPELDAKYPADTPPTVVPKLDAKYPADTPPAVATEIDAKQPPAVDTPPVAATQPDAKCPPAADTPPAVAAQPDATQPPQPARSHRTADHPAPADKNTETDDTHGASALGGEVACHDMPDRALRMGGDAPCGVLNAVPESDAAMAASLALPSPDTAAGDGAGSRPSLTPMLPDAAAATALVHAKGRVPLQAQNAPHGAPPEHANGQPGGPKVTVTPPATPPASAMLAPATAAAALQFQAAEADTTLETGVKLAGNSGTIPPIAIAPAAVTPAAVAPAAGAPGQANDGAGFNLGANDAGHYFAGAGVAFAAVAATPSPLNGGEGDEFGTLLSAKIAPTAAIGGPAGLAAGTPAARTAAPTSVTASFAPPREAALDQIAVQVRKAVADGLDHISIRLKPAELGLIDINLDIAADGRVAAHVTANRPETLELLQRDARSLERTLQDAGLRADTGALSFGLRGDGNANSSGRGPLEFGSAPHTETETAAPIPPALPAARIVADGRIDLHV